MNLLSKTRNHFDAMASDYEKHAIMQAEVRERMLQRLQYFKIQPEVIIDLGCGPGQGIALLQQRYPKAVVMGVDWSFMMLSKAQSKSRWWHKKMKWVCADANHLPFADASVDCIVANQLLPWIKDIQVFFSECYRVLKPQGLLLFTTLGPDSFKALNEGRAYGLDMHDIGDDLLQQGFNDPVMDREDLILNYPDSHALQHALHAQGQDFVVKDECSISYELIYGQAWRGEKRQKGSVQTISLEKLRSSIPSKT